MRNALCSFKVEDGVTVRDFITFVTHMLRKEKESNERPCTLSAFYVHAPLNSATYLFADEEKEKSILRLLLVHVDSENHTHNGEKILMINLFNFIEKKTGELFLCYPDIWKGYNSFFFFYILPTLYEDKNLRDNFFSILKNSENAHKNIYISLLLLNSNNFPTKIKTLKYIFHAYVLKDKSKNGWTGERKKELINRRETTEKVPFEKATFTNFLVENGNSSNEAKRMSCFFFSVVGDLIRRDYISVLKERKKENNKMILTLVNKKMDKKKVKTTDDYINSLICYSVSKSIFSSHFHQLENNIFSENIIVDGKCGSRYHLSDNEMEENIDACVYINSSGGNKQSILFKRGNVYSDLKHGAVISCQVEKQYDENFLRGVFFYIKNLVEYYEELVASKKNSQNEMNKNYISCFVINCVYILFNICCLNNIFINSSYDLIKNIKKRLTCYMNTVIVIAMAEFVLFFSTDEEFVNVSNYLFIHFSKEYKNYLSAITFFDFVMKNVNILNERKFFFKKYCSIILKTYFYHYRIFKNDLIYILPHLIYENNYKDVFCFLLYAPLLISIENMVTKRRDIDMCSVLSKRTNKKFNFLKNFQGSQGEGRAKVLVQELDNIQVRREAKNERRVKEIVKNMHKYFKIYFDIILYSNNERWVCDITKVILYKLSCADILEMLNKESVKEILKSLNDIININSKILLLFKSEFINLLKNESNYSFLINRKVLEIMAQNIKHMKITYNKIVDYYITLNSFFSSENFKEVKFWISLIHAFTNIAIYCHDLSGNILETYQNFISQKNATLLLKHIVLENINIIKNISYFKNVK
ncbi:conserved Plasmodium protein, unknown function [Plasmodium ovale curtisi]|uniref:Uncharacterized protein n=1 Tax=Plasmodium ovale curtisi TaxID=864141 RepID=A0A1A8VVP6_PLAOA|nr:conserved Plasmodium protein, unknown function [Plasmodium ovale curtisi]